MFFYLSKIIGFFLLPSHILVGMSGLGIFLLWTRWQTAARLCIGTGVAGLLIIGFSPLGNILILPLEERFPNEIPASTKSFAGIIVLGGGISSNLSFHRQQALTNEAGERILGAAELVRRFPNIPVIYSGGSNALWDEKNSEARMVEEFILPVVKIDPNIVRFEIRAKNTYENAIEVKKMIQEPASDPWLLVTSAYHMPRAEIEISSLSGRVRITPYPVAQEPWVVWWQDSDELRRLMQEYGKLLLTYLRQSGNETQREAPEIPDMPDSETED